MGTVLRRVGPVSVYCDLVRYSGASRLELCGNLIEGGTTPSAGLLRVVKKHVDIPVFVMIRPRGGDFCFDEIEMAVMKAEIKMLKDAGADGFVFGILNKDGGVDTDHCKELLDETKPLPSTFHRAIDMSKDISQALSQIVMLGFQRVLTSGSVSTAFDGRHVIAEMVKEYGDKIIIVPGGGINTENLRVLLKETGVKEFHGTARETLDSCMKYRKVGVAMGAIPSNEFTHKRTSMKIVTELVDIANSVWLS